ncbi:hypothetical protein CW304_31710 [Bacillus sp. UFRGS-B20]|nr:hypothetical protein CW304_31710 [Bacillus sp. UFRGS-B20]
MQETKRLQRKVVRTFPSHRNELYEINNCYLQFIMKRDRQEAYYSFLCKVTTVPQENSFNPPRFMSLLKELLELGLKHFDIFFLQTRRLTPSFLENGMTNVIDFYRRLNQEAELIDAYRYWPVINIVSFIYEHLHGRCAQNC